MRGRSPPRLPVALEAIGRLVDPGPLASLGVAHSGLRGRFQILVPQCVALGDMLHPLRGEDAKALQSSLVPQ